MLRAIKDLSADGVSPSYDELAARCGLTGRGQVSALLNILRRKGRVTWEPNRARTIQVVDDSFTQVAADLSPLRLRGVIEEAAEAWSGPSQPARPRHAGSRSRSRQWP